MSADILPPLARLEELLAALSCPAWVEDATGKILAQNTKVTVSHGRRRTKTTIYPLPVLAGAAGILRLVTLSPTVGENAHSRRIISTLFAKLLMTGQSTAAATRLTPAQRAILKELGCGFHNKEVAAKLGISHSNLLVQITRMRKAGVEIPFSRQRRK